jgi:transposase
MPNEEYVTPRQAADIAGRDRQTIYRWFREKKLTRFKVGPTGPGRRGRTRVKLSELQALLEPRACEDSATR